MKKNLQKGFTLIELLVVIAIIGILSSVVLASVSSARAKAQRAAFRAEVAGAVPGWVSTCDDSAITATSTNIVTWAITQQDCTSTGAGTFSVTATAGAAKGSDGTTLCTAAVNESRADFSAVAGC